MTLADIELVILEDVEEGVPCESSLRSHDHPHDADWYAIGPCRDVIAVCHQRRMKAFRDGGWKCFPKDGHGCHAFHDWDHLSWEPVRNV